LHLRHGQQLIWRDKIARPMLRLQLSMTALRSWRPSAIQGSTEPAFAKQRPVDKH
jgi:hypothetical protein